MSNSKKRANRKAKNRNSEYQQRLEQLRQIGVYEPKGDDLTPYRKKRINQEWRKYSRYIEPDVTGKRKFFFVGTDKLTNAERREFVANAKSLDMPTTPKGVFIQKEGQRKARLAWNNENKEYDILLTGKVKWGENKGKAYSDRIPIGPLDRIEGELNRIENVAKQFGTLKKGEAISFVVMEHGEEVGASRQTFSSPGAAEKLRNYLDTRYHRDNKAARLKFLRMVTVRKTTVLDWSRAHPPREKRMARKQRRKIGYRPK